MSTNETIINSMVKLLEEITEEPLDLAKVLKDNPDFSGFLKGKAKSEMGGHIPNKDAIDNINYCVNPEFAGRIIEFSEI